MSDQTVEGVFSDAETQSPETVTNGVDEAVKVEEVENVNEEQATQEEAEDPVKTEYERRISRQRAALASANKKIEELVKAQQELASKGSKEEFSSANTGDDKPKLEDFVTEEEYETALLGYMEQKAMEKVEERNREEQARRYQEQQRISFERKQEEFAEKVPDYHESVEVLQEYLDTVDKNNPVFTAFSQAVLDSENTGALFYYLSKNPDEVARIESMTPQQAYREIVKLDLSLANKSFTPKAEKKPKPPSSIGSTSKTEVSDSDFVMKLARS